MSLVFIGVGSLCFSDCTYSFSIDSEFLLNITKASPKQKIKFDAGEETASSEHKNSKKKPKRKRTKYYKVDDPEEMLNAAIKLAEEKGYKITKSDKYYSAKLKVKEEDEFIKVTINVIKRSEKEKRSLEFILNKGSKQLFKTVFSTFKNCCKARFA